MEPDEAEDVRRLMSYAEETAGAMMTPEPVILGPDATIADALAQIRRRGAPGVAGGDGLRVPAAAGDPHRQAARRRPLPATAARAALDPGRGRPGPVDGPAPSRGHASTRSPPTSRPTTWSPRPWSTTHGRLLGAVTVDDLLDHMLPENWRDQPLQHRHPAGGEPWLSARGRPARHPQGAAPSADPDAVVRPRRVRRVRRAVRALHGHGAVPDVDDGLRRLLDRAGTRWRRATCGSTSTRSSS